MEINYAVFLTAMAVWLIVEILFLFFVSSSYFLKIGVHTQCTLFPYSVCVISRISYFCQIWNAQFSSKLTSYLLFLSECEITILYFCISLRFRGLNIVWWPIPRNLIFSSKYTEGKVTAFLSFTADFFLPESSPITAINHRAQK